MSHMIHISRDGEAYGPYPRAEAVQYLAEGALVATDLSWHEGLPDWQPLGEVLKPKLKPVPRRPMPAAQPAVAQTGKQTPEAEAKPQATSSSRKTTEADSGQLKTVMVGLAVLLIVAVAIPIYLKTRTDKRPKVPYEDAGLPQNFGTDGSPDLRALSEVLRMCVMTPGQIMPKTIEELVDRKFIRQLPAPPAGQRYQVDSVNVAVKLVPGGK